MLTARFSLIAGALLGVSGVVLGAWGAHGLSAYIENANLAAWDTAVSYQLFHALALLCVTALMTIAPSTHLKFAVGALLVGVVLFSGSLYVLVLGGPAWLGPLTPLGGVVLILGWLGLLRAGINWSGE